MSGPHSLARRFSGLWFFSLLPAWQGLSAQNLPSVSFKVETSPNDLALETEYAPDQTPITHVRIRGASEYDQPGLPRLPYYFRFVAIPAGAKVAQVRVNTGQGVTRQGVSMLSWGQIARPGREPAPPTFQKSDQGSVYRAASDTVPLSPLVQQVQSWPPVHASAYPAEERGGFDIVKVAVFPVAWIPLKGVLTHFPSIDVTLDYSGGKLPQLGKDYATALELEELRDLVVNPSLIPGIDLPVFPETLDAWHLIITSASRWNPTTMEPTLRLAGDLTAEFQRLADWKTAKGVLSAVVTVEDIVDGRYGNFTTGSRDLQEVLRKFLKKARRDFHTSWVLLGGDYEVVPPREVLGNVWGGGHHFHWDNTKPKPDRGNCIHDAATATVRIHNNGLATAAHSFFSQKTGKQLSRVSAPSLATPGWAYATDDSYSSVSVAPTEYILLRGAPADIEGTSFYVNDAENTIPTDLYYSSLVSPLYDRPGLHDWDLTNNGVYGQADWVIQLDGVDFTPDLRLGRAPVDSGTEARAFVDKVIAYERYEGVPEDFGRRFLLGASNWYGGPAVNPTTDNPPGEGHYFQAAGTTTARLHFKGPPGPETSWKLVAYNAPGDWNVIPYNRFASASSLGWHYCTDASYSTRSELVLDVGPFHYELPIPTSFVRVLGPAPQLHPGVYFFDDERPESSVVEKEEIRSIVATSGPALNIRKRLYQDYVDTPDYPAPDLSELSEPAMRMELGFGYNIVSLSGHGYWGGCCGVDASYVDDITNGKRGGLVYADSCLTGQFNLNDAVAEIFVKSALGGSAAYVGNTRFSWIGLGHVLEKDFWERLSTSRQVGRLHNTRSYHATDWSEQWANFSLTLFGDPEMPLWVGTPGRMSVAHPSIVTKGNTLTVRVKRADGTPLPLAKVCLTGPRGIFELRFTGATGAVDFSTGDKAIGDNLRIAVTKTDFVPYEGSVRVQGSLANIFIRGDANLDGRIDLSDGLKIFGVLFQGQGKLDCLDGADANDDGSIDISDGVKILNVLFLGDQLPKGTTFGKPQEDTTPDNLGC